MRGIEFESSSIRACVPQEVVEAMLIVMRMSREVSPVQSMAIFEIMKWIMSVGLPDKLDPDLIAAIKEAAASAAGGKVA